MFVRLEVGARAGEIVEMKFMDARVLLDDGRATPAYPSEIATAPRDRPVEAMRSAQPAVATGKKAKGKR
jgi:hypothetical protein